MSCCTIWTSTYFESDPTFTDKRRFGYSRDKRSDCVQVVIALIVTPQGFPLTYEVMAGNTSDKTTLADFLEKIESQYGRSERVWIMDRGIPTEETLSAMRAGESPVHYLVGTPKGRLTRLEKAFVGLPWREVRGIGPGEAVGRGRRTVHPGPEPSAHPEGARHAPAPAEEAVEAVDPAGQHRAIDGRNKVWGIRSLVRTERRIASCQDSFTGIVIAGIRFPLIVLQLGVRKHPNSLGGNRVAPPAFGAFIGPSSIHVRQ